MTEINGNKDAFPYWQKMCTFLTRRCNTRCRGCNVINYQSAYEMTTAEWKKAFDIAKFYGVGFIILFGGEPTLRNDLPDLIKYLNKINMPHTVITNSIRLLQDKEFYKKFIESKPYGVSCSLNEISHGKARFGDEYKSEKGYQLLQQLKKDLPSCDLVANMAITRDNIKRLPTIVQWLTSHEIWVILTFIHLSNPHHATYWWYRGPEDKDNIKLKLTKEDIPTIRKIASWFKENYDSLLLHNSKDYFDMWDNIAITQDWKCTRYTNPNINPDGLIMPCIDRLLDVPINILDLPEKEKEFQIAFDRSIENCPGCCWDHMRETNMYAEKDMVEEAKILLAHKTGKLLKIQQTLNRNKQ